jgi:hypothetical protein
MCAVGPDPGYYGLGYFEWQADAARRFAENEET